MYKLSKCLRFIGSPGTHGDICSSILPSHNQRVFNPVCSMRQITHLCQRKHLHTRTWVTLHHLCLAEIYTHWLLVMLRRIFQTTTEPPLYPAHRDSCSADCASHDRLTDTVNIPACVKLRSNYDVHYTEHECTSSLSLYRTQCPE